MAVRVREEYRRLSREELLQRVYDLGATYEINSFSCSQSTVAALYRVLDFPDALVKASCSNAGGTAMQLVGTCGGLVGGIMVLDYFFGRPFEHMSDKEMIQDPNINDLFVAQPVARSLVTKYIKEYGTITCVNIQLQLYGRFFTLKIRMNLRNSMRLALIRTLKNALVLLVMPLDGPWKSCLTRGP